MQIQKVLIVESPVHLFRLLRAKEEALDLASDEEYHLMSSFLDSVDLFLNGCRCDEDANFSEMMSIYERIRNYPQDNMKAVFECDRIEFK